MAANLRQIYMSKVLRNLQLQSRCINNLSGSALYSNDDHLSNAGTRLLTPEIVISGKRFWTMKELIKLRLY